MKVYFDSAATTQMHEEVIDAMVNGMKEKFGNPSSTHFFGRESKAEIEKVRKDIAKYTGVNASEIIFTSCGTEANNLIIRSVVEHLGVERIITSVLEHKCVAETTKEVCSKKDLELLLLPIKKDGNLDFETLEKYLKDSPKKTLVTLMHANNEIGNIYDIEKIGKICEENQAYFHSDMVQTLGHFAINLHELPVHFASSSAHKYHGPKGAGFAYIKKGTGLKAQITGGGQERNLRSGTENLHGILGMGKAFEMANQNFDNEIKRIKSLKKYTIKKLNQAFPDIIYNGKSADLEESLYTILSVLLPFHDSLIGFELDLKGIAASQGSACSSGASKASAVITALHDASVLKATTPLRLSFSIYNSEEEIDYLVQSLVEIAEKQKARNQAKEN